MDPMTVLNTPYEDIPALRAFVNRGVQARVEHDQRVADYQAHKIAALVIPAMSRNTNNLLKWFSRALKG